MILHLPFTYFPDPPGGTEIYLASLLAGLRARGWPVAVATHGVVDSLSEHESVPVYRYAGSAGLSREQVWTRSDPTSVRSFAALLARLKPRLLHFHGLTSGMSAEHAASAQAAGIPWMLTYHTPSVTCSRGDMMQFGAVPCDGQMRDQRCAACTLHKFAVPQSLATLIAMLPNWVGQLSDPDSRLGLALHARQWLARSHADTRRVLSGATRIVAVCDWVREVLRCNQVPESKLLLSRQGLRHDFPQLEKCAPRQPRELWFLGRADPVKGIEVVIRALRAAPELNIRLKLYLVAQEATLAYVDSLRALAAGDARIEFSINQPAQTILRGLAGATALLVPSLWLETGPLTVLEAQAAGVPVIGSDRGGIAELVQPGKNGWLLPAGDVKAWRAAFEQIARSPAALDALREKIDPPRRSDAAVADHHALYESVLGPCC